MLHRRLKKIFCGGMLTMLVLCSAAPAAALPSKPLITEMEEEYLTNTMDYPKGVYAAMSANERDDYSVPFSATKTWHVQGETTKITLPGGYQYGLKAEKAFAVSVTNAQIEKLANAAFSTYVPDKFDVRYSVEFETQKNIGFSLDEEAGTGYYCLSAVYPVKQLYLEVVGYDSSDVRNVLGMTGIAYAPGQGNPYFVLEYIDSESD